MQPVKNLVKTKDYHSYILHQTTLWNNIKNHVLKERSDKIQSTTEQEVERKYFMGFSYKESKLKQVSETGEIIDLNNKLNIVEQRLELLENEWNRTEYYILYKFEMIEILPELTNSFFSYAMQEIKSSITYN